MELKLQGQHSPPPVHGIQKHLNPAVKPEHDKPVPTPNKQRGPISADARPKVLLRPKLPASQIVRKRLIDKSIKQLNKPKSQISLPKRPPNLPSLKPPTQSRQPHKQLPTNDDNTDNANPPPNINQPANNKPAPIRHFEPNPLLEIPQEDKDPQEISNQHPVPSTDNPVTRQDPFDTQMEVPFAELNQSLKDRYRRF